MQTSTKRAAVVAGYTAVYLLLAWFAVTMRFDFGIFSYLLYPAALVLLAPAPILSVVNLADHDWLLGTWPSTGGFFVLILVYSTLAYFVTKSISETKSHDSIHARHDATHESDA